MNLLLGNRYTAREFYEPIGWLVALWCVGLFCGAGFALTAGQTHYMSIQALISSDYSFYGNLVISLIFLVLPSGLIWCHISYRFTIYTLALIKGVAFGFFLCFCLLSSPQSGWLLAFLLQFSNLITLVPIFDYWIKCLILENKSLLFLLLSRCCFIVLILLIERFWISLFLF